MGGSAEKMDSVFVLAIFCIFAASVLLVLMLGGSVYQNTNEIINENYDERTALSYIWSRVKNGDEAERVFVGTFEGLSALFLEEMYGEYTFQTLIYYYDGWIREMFCEVGYYFEPEFGQQILRASELTFSTPYKGIIQATTAAGSIMIAPRSQLAIGR